MSSGLGCEMVERDKRVVTYIQMVKGRDVICHDQGTEELYDGLGEYITGRWFMLMYESTKQVDEMVNDKICKMETSTIYT